MARLTTTVLLLLAPIAVSNAFAQGGEAPIRVFGYFQNSLQHWSSSEDRPESNSFGLQQLNLLLQKDLRADWTAFINFEVLNNFSSTRQWGALNLEEAWVRYRRDMRFNLKLGLLIPTFNNLNEINNRTPLLPYVIRPLIYETSFNEFIVIEEFVPARAFVQAYGFFPFGESKLDYAVFAGNSPNINSDPQRGQTGTDTTATILVGGRLGIRYQELKLGFSATREKDNQFQGLGNQFQGLPAQLGRAAEELKEVLKTRLGGDLSYNFSGFLFESEFASANLGGDIPELGVDLDFYYATLGYNFTERLLVYGSYWLVKARFDLLAPDDEFIDDEKIITPNVGVSFDLDERIRFKAQYAHVRLDDHERYLARDEVKKDRDIFNVYAAAVSVFF